MNWLKSNFWLTLILFLGLTGAFYFAVGFPGSDVALNVSASPGEPKVGVPFDLKVDFANNSRNSVKDVRLQLNLPNGAVLIPNGDDAVKARNLGEIKSGGLQSEIFRVLGVPAEGNDREFTVTASYSSEGLVARFEKKTKFTVRLADTGVSLSLKAPNKVFSGEEFETIAEYKKPENEFPGLRLEFNYPETFVLMPSSPDPDVRNQIWNIKKNEGKIIVRGKVDLPDESVFTIKATLVTKLQDKDYQLTSSSADIAISKSPLSLNISLSDGSSPAYYPGEDLNYTLNFRNNTEVALQALTLRAQLLGAMYDFQSLKSGGSFSNVNNTIIWDSRNISDLKSLGPGESRNINFSIKLKPDYPIRRLNDKNFALKVKARAESPTVPYLVNADKTVSSAVLESKVGGKIAVRALGYFRDAPAGILNDGPLPPRLGTPTDFTIHFVLTNYSTDVSGVEVRARLEDGVVFTGKVKANTSSVPESVSDSGEVVWKIDRLFATAGITGDKPEAVFQVRATPRSNHVGSYMPLISGTEVKAHDEFTGVSLNFTSLPITTRLEGDPTVGEKDGIVIQ